MTRSPLLTRLKPLTLSASTLREIETVRALAQLLGVDYWKTLSFVLYRLPDADKYRSFTIRKKSGGERKIDTPRPILRGIQQRLLPSLSLLYDAPPFVHGNVLGRSILTNASDHIGRKYVVNVDISDFFPSIHFSRIVGILTSSRYGLSRNIAVAIAQIVCKSGKLPIGAPTSGVISNIVAGPLDSALVRHAKRHGLRYSRYVDDITFSASTPMALEEGLGVQLDGRLVTHDSTELSDEFRGLFLQHGFSLNPAKVRVSTRHVRQSVTGIVVNRKANVPIEFFRSLRGAINSLQKHGAANAQKRYDEIRRTTWSNSIEENILGRLSHLGNITNYNQRYIRLARRAKAVLDSSRILIPISEPQRTCFRAITLVDGDEGTAFHIGAGYFLTAAHVFDPNSELRLADLSQPDTNIGPIRARVTHIDFNLDIALLAANATQCAQLPVARLIERDVAPGDEVTTFGYPEYHEGNTCSSIVTRVTSTRFLFGEHRVAVDRGFPHGISGGPVFDAHGFCVGVAMSGPQLSNIDAPIATTFTGYRLFSKALSIWLKEASEGR